MGSRLSSTTEFPAAPQLEPDEEPSVPDHTAATSSTAYSHTSFTLVDSVVHINSTSTQQPFPPTRSRDTSAAQASAFSPENRRFYAVWVLPGHTFSGVVAGNHLSGWIFLCEHFPPGRVPSARPYLSGVRLRRCATFEEALTTYFAERHRFGITASPQFHFG